MSNVEDAFCPNKNCKDFGVLNQGNIGKRGKYVKIKRDIFYIAEHVELVLRQRKQQRSLGFICQKIR